MKKFFFISLLLIGSVSVFCQTTSTFIGDVDKANGLIRNGAYKNGYKYLIKFVLTNQAAINVTPNTSYLIFFVYDHQTPGSRFQGAFNDSR